MNKVIENSKKSRFYSRGLFWILIAIICLGGFFAFKTLGKTTYTLNFLIDSFKDIAIEEVAEIKISRSGKDFDTLKGKKITVDKDENVLVRVYLNEGYQAIKSEGSTYYLSATGTINENAFCSQDGFFEWELGKINENKEINIKGIQIKKLYAEPPVIIDTDGNELEFNKIKENWQGSLDYGEKFKFQIDLNNGEKSYSIKEIKASVKPKSKILNLSSEITNTQEDKYDIVLYDETNRFGGIKSSINSIEIFVEEVRNEEILPATAEAEATEPVEPPPVMVDRKITLKSEDQPESLNEKIDVYFYNGSNAPAQGSEINLDQFGKLDFDTTNKCFSQIYNVDSTSTDTKYFFIDVKEKYSQSNILLDPSLDTIDISMNSKNVKLYSVVLNEDKEIKISGFEANKYNVQFKLSEGTSPDEEYLSRFTLYSGKDENNFFDDIKDLFSEESIEHGSVRFYRISVSENYEFENINLNFLQGTGIIISNSNSEIIFKIDGIKENTTVEIPKIKYKMFKVYIRDKEGNDIKNKVTIKKQNMDSDSELTFESGSKIEFQVELKNGYEGFDEVVANGFSFNIEKINEKRYNIVSNEQIKSDAELRIYGIKVQKLDAMFRCLVPSYKAFIDISYKAYNEYPGGHVQDGNEVNIKFDELNSALIPYGHDFEFTIKILDSRYSMPAENIKSYINSNNLIGYGVDDIVATKIGNSIKVTFKNVKKSLGNDNDISIEKLDLMVKTVTFNVEGEEIKNKITIYSHEDPNNFQVDDQKKVYSVQSSVNKIELIQGNDSFIAVELLEGSAASENGIKCKLTGSNSNIELLNVNSSNKIYIFKIPGDKLNSNDLVINISGIELMKPKISFENFENATISQITDLGEQEIKDKLIEVKYGESLKLKITAKEGHLVDNVQESLLIESVDGKNDVIPIPGELSDKSYEFTIPKITYDLAISLSLKSEKVIVNFSNIEGITYGKVTPTADGYTFDEELKGSVLLGYGRSYYFAIKANAGYDLSTADIITKNIEKGRILEDEKYFTEMQSNDPNMRVFMLNNVIRNLDISGTIKKVAYKINLKREAELTGKENARDNKTYINYYQSGKEVSELNVEHGSDVEFSMLLEEKCNQSAPTVQVYVNDELKDTLSYASGVYKIIDVKQDMEVRVSNLTWNKYVLNFEKNNYVSFLGNINGKQETIEGIKSVNHGDEYNFKVQEKPGYALNNKTIVQAESLSGRSQELKKDSRGNYKLSDITEDYTIKIKNIDDVVYTIEFTPVEGVTYYNDQGNKISGKTKVDYGKNFEFSVGIDDAYSDSIQGIQIVVNNSSNSNVRVQKLSSGRYLIQSVTEDVNIKAVNISKNKYTVTLTKDEGIEYYSISNKIITGDNEVSYGENLNFRVKLSSLYSNSNIRVMLGNKEILPNSENVYTIEDIQEGKTVTVVGIEKNVSSTLVDMINGLPSVIRDDTDAQEVINATKAYNSLDEFQKKDIINYNVLQSLQEKVGELNHSYSGVVAEGLPWNIKLIANPIIDNTDACSRIYEKLDNSYLLSLYDVYLIDTVTNRRYTLSEGQSVVIHLPTPNMTYFERPTGIHENSNGKIDYLNLNINNETTSLETSSLSPIGVAAERSQVQGRSSLLDAVDADISSLMNYDLGFLSSSNKSSSPINLVNNNYEEDISENNDESLENKDSKMVDNSKTPLGSALKLILILMIILIILAIIATIVNKNKKNKLKP